MALFKRKQNTKEKPVAEASASMKIGAIPGHLAHVLRHGRITEKASMHIEKGAYLFDVAPRATKQDIKKAVFSVYKVQPRMIRVVTIPSKRKRSSRTGKVGVKHGGKKAYVYLKKGETITITQ